MSDIGGALAPNAGALLPSPALGIDTSCGCVASAVVLDGVGVRASVNGSQLQGRPGMPVTRRGGDALVDLLNPVVARTLLEAGMEGPDLQCLGVVVGPGRRASIEVGVASAKALSMAWGVPLVGVNRLEATLEGLTLGDGPLELPAVVALVSDQHCLVIRIDRPGRPLVVAATVDETPPVVLGKLARRLGGPEAVGLDVMTIGGDPEAVDLATWTRLGPTGAELSFSALKNAALRHLDGDVDLADLAASFEAAVVDSLLGVARHEAQQAGARTLAIAGEFSTHLRLRERSAEIARVDGLVLRVPRDEFCIPEAATVAAVGHRVLLESGPSGLGLVGQPSARLPTADLR